MKSQHCNDPDCPGIPRCPCIKPEYYDKIEKEELQAEKLKKDAERYRRLAILIEAGDWHVGYDLLNDEILLHDKTELDAVLDDSETIENANGWKKALKNLKGN